MKATSEKIGNIRGYDVYRNTGRDGTLTFTLVDSDGRRHGPFSRVTDAMLFSRWGERRV